MGAARVWGGCLAPSSAPPSHLASLGRASPPQRNATGYFNVLNEEGRVVVGALLAPDPDVPLAQVLPDVKPPLEQDIWSTSHGSSAGPPR